jgi:(p)ppGpp synthase/HD superfamily hydrolase
MLHDMTIVKPVKDILAELVQKDEESQALVTLAYSFAEHAHRDQKRYSGEPYFLHSAQVGYSLAQIGMDAATVATLLKMSAPPRPRSKKNSAKKYCPWSTA